LAGDALARRAPCWKIALMRRALFAACALLASACGSGSGSGEDAEEELPEGITLAGVVREFELGVPRQNYAGIGGVEVCVEEHDEVPCVTTGDDGTFSLEHAPMDEDLVLTFTKLGYVPALRQVTTGAEDYDILAETVLGSVEDALAQAQQLGVSASASATLGGLVQFFGVTPGDGVLQVATLADYTVTLTDSSGEPASCDVGTGPAPCRPVYLDEHGDADPALERATSIGVGAIGMLAPGEYVLTYTHPTLACTEHLPESGFDGPEPNSIRVRVVGLISATTWLR